MSQPNTERLAEALKPCPFCGGTAKHTYVETYGAHTSYYVIRCPECSASVDASEILQPEEIAAWNRRALAAHTSAPSPAGGEHTPEPFACENCGRPHTAQEVVSLRGNCAVCGDTVTVFTVDAAQYLVALQAKLQAASPWIAVSPEGMPEKRDDQPGVRCLAGWEQYGLVHAAVYWDASRRFGTENGDSFAEQPTHWQPLPAAPTPSPTQQKGGGL